MIPVHFGAREHPLFGCYDPAAASAARRRAGVAILNPTGWELLRAHRTLRTLALRLAGAGFDVLRFDYSGTGDSWGDPRSDASFARWTQDAVDAIEELQGLASVDRVHLVGIRHGCRVALAAAASQRPLVGRIVLWDPAPLPSSDTPVASSARPVDDVPSLDTPHAILRALSSERPTLQDWMLDRSLRVLSNGESLPADLRDARGDLLEGDPEGRPCWVEEREFGAGAVPTALLERITSWIATEGRKS